MPEKRCQATALLGRQARLVLCLLCTQYHLLVHVSVCVYGVFFLPRVGNARSGIFLIADAFEPSLSIITTFVRNSIGGDAQPCKPNQCALRFRYLIVSWPGYRSVHDNTEWRVSINPTTTPCCKILSIMKIRDHRPLRDTASKSCFARGDTLRRLRVVERARPGNALCDILFGHRGT